MSKVKQDTHDETTPLLPVPAVVTPTGAASTFNKTEKEPAAVASDGGGKVRRAEDDTGEKESEQQAAAAAPGGSGEDEKTEDENKKGKGKGTPNPEEKSKDEAAVAASDRRDKDGGAENENNDEGNAKGKAALLNVDTGGENVDSPENDQLSTPIAAAAEEGKFNDYPFKNLGERPEDQEPNYSKYVSPVSVSLFTLYDVVFTLIQSGYHRFESVIELCCGKVLMSVAANCAFLSLGGIATTQHQHTKCLHDIKDVLNNQAECLHDIKDVLNNQAEDLHAIKKTLNKHGEELKTINTMNKDINRKLDTLIQQLNQNNE